VGLVPLSEGGRIDLDDSTLDEGVGTDQLVVGSIVHLGATIKTSVLGCISGTWTHDTDDTSLPGGVL